MMDQFNTWDGVLLVVASYVAIISLVVFFVIGFFALLAIPMRRAIIAAGNQPPRVL